MNARKTLVSLLTASALAVAATAAVAHGGPGGHGGPGAGRGMGPNPEMLAQRMTDLRTLMKLNDGQTQVWASYETAVKRAVEGGAKLRDSMQGARGNLDAMDDARVAMLKFRAQSAEEINQARKALVATLTPEQKATFDRYRPGARAAQGRGPGQGPGYGPHHGGRGPGQPT